MMKEGQKIDFNALIKLLDDPDRRVFDEVSARLRDFGPAIIPELEKAWEGSFNQVVQERLENIIEEIQSSNTRKALAQWAGSASKNIFEGAFIIAKMQYPDLKYSDLDQSIEKIRKDVWLELNDRLTALEKVRMINHIMYDVYGFKPNRTSFYAPQNNYINIVLDSKLGNPISLSLIYQEVARRLSLPVYSVLLPGQFILAYVDPYVERPSELKDPDRILFYIHPFNRGYVLGKKEIDEYLKEQNIESSDHYYLPSDSVKVVSRLISNLIFAYNKLGYPEKVTLYKELHHLLRK